MAWFDRPEGFITKSHDIYGPSVEVANGIRFSARIGTFTPLCPRHPSDPHREDFCGQCLDDYLDGIAAHEDDSWAER